MPGTAASRAASTGCARRRRNTPSSSRSSAATLPPPTDRLVFELALSPGPDDIDELGHVNNAVYVRWIQDVATAHWRAVAPPGDSDRVVWLVTRHEIDYRRATLPGETLVARTWVGEPKGARFDRFVEIVGADDTRLRVAARTVWAMVDRTTLRPLRVPSELAARFAAANPH